MALISNRLIFWSPTPSERRQEQHTSSEEIQIKLQVDREVMEMNAVRIKVNLLITRISV